MIFPKYSGEQKFFPAHLTKSSQARCGESSLLGLRIGQFACCPWRSYYVPATIGAAIVGDCAAIVDECRIRAYTVVMKENRWLHICRCKD
jgi:hypothetical protein